MGVSGWHSPGWWEFAEGVFAEGVAEGVFVGAVGVFVGAVGVFVGAVEEGIEEVVEEVAGEGIEEVGWVVEEGIGEAAGEEKT